MIRALVLPAILIAMTTSAFAYTDAELQSALVGTWGNVEGCAGPVLVFNADGTFSQRVSTDATEVKGTYQIKDGKLTGVIDGGSEMPEATLLYDGTTMNFVEGDNKTPLYACPK